MPLGSFKWGSRYREILLLLFWLILKVESAWLTIGSSTAGYYASYSDRSLYNVVLIAGRSYNIVFWGYTSWDTWLTVGDSNGVYTYNDDWGGSTYPKSAGLTFVPSLGGICSISPEPRATSSSNYGNWYLYVAEVTSCSSTCTSKSL